MKNNIQTGLLKSASFIKLVAIDLHLMKFFEYKGETYGIDPYLEEIFKFNKINQSWSTVSTSYFEIDYFSSFLHINEKMYWIDLEQQKSWSYNLETQEWKEEIGEMKSLMSIHGYKFIFFSTNGKGYIGSDSHYMEPHLWEFLP